MPDELYLIKCCCEECHHLEWHIITLAGQLLCLGCFSRSIDESPPFAILSPDDPSSLDTDFISARSVESP